MDSLFPDLKLELTRWFLSLGNAVAIEVEEDMLIFQSSEWCCTRKGNGE